MIEAEGPGLRILTVTPTKLLAQNSGQGELQPENFSYSIGGILAVPSYAIHIAERKLAVAKLDDRMSQKQGRERIRLDCGSGESLPLVDRPGIDRH
jgi:hypothetical protein